MKDLRPHLAAIAVSAVLLNACSGGSSSAITPAAAGAGTNTQAPPTGTAGATSFTYGAAALQSAQYVGPSSAVTIGVDVQLAIRNPSGLEQFAQSVNNPKSANYRHFLTPEQIGAAYGATQPDLTAAAQYFSSYNLHVGTWPQHLSLFVAGSTANMQKAFGTQFGVYQQGSETFIAPASTPHFAKALPVAAVSNLVTLHHMYRTSVPSTGIGITTSGYAPQPIRNAFDYTGAYNAGYTGSGITVGIIGTGPISSADVPAYGSMFNTSVATVTQHDVTDTGIAAPGIENPPDTGFQTPPPTTTQCSGNLPACNPEDVEAQLDTESIASLAPGSNVYFYLGYDPAYCLTHSGTIVAGPCGAVEQPLEGIDVADDEIQQVIADNSVDVLSLSYGGPEQSNAGIEFSSTNPDTGLGPEEFAALAAEGITVFVSSGDSGAEGCQRPAYLPAIDQACVSYPATDPSVTSVGGVNAPLDRFGNLTNQITGWGLEADRGHGGSGGGISAYFPQTLTPWQVNIPGVQGSNRNQPDVSLLGDPATGMAALLYANLGGPLVESVGGTSVAAPEMAAMWALVLQACKQSASCATAQGAHPYRLGNAAPLLYAQYATSGSATILPTYAQTFYDVLYGDNQQIVASPGPTSPPLDPGYNAGPGYDLVTGLGVPFARSLIKAVTHQ
ncbi:MAG: S8/S53 family peptidase [Candidatus Eremiobacteraeota bacterium]|nr:S8/S53 family peptidase [Candidatus Eremiobacteraeota bacterium]